MKVLSKKRKAPFCTRPPVINIRGHEFSEYVEEFDLETGGGLVIVIGEEFFWQIQVQAKKPRERRALRGQKGQCQAGLVSSSAATG